MISDHQIAIFPDQNNLCKFSAEVNWEDKETTNESKIIKLSCECGKTAYIKRERLNEFLFRIGNAEDQRKMIPQTIHRVHTQTMKLAIKATKDIQKGEEIVLNDIKVNIPCSVVDKIGEVNIERGLSKLPILGKYLKG